VRVGGLVSRMRETAPVEDPPQLVRRIVTATRGLSKGEPGAPWWLAWAPWVWQPRFAIGLATVAASLAIVFHATGVRPADVAKLDYRPTSVARAVDRHAHLGYARCVKFVYDLRLVYEIESRFASAPAPVSEPANSPVPSAQPEQAPPSTKFSPSNKSQFIPRPGQREVRRGSALAELIRTFSFDGNSRRVV
jgi:hypothetical protein